MNTTPTDIKVEIRLTDGTPITDKNTDVWGFGYDGQVEFSDGAILAYTESPIAPVAFLRGRSKRVKQKKLNKFAERFGYFGDIPNDGNLSATYQHGSTCRRHRRNQEIQDAYGRGRHFPAGV